MYPSLKELKNDYLKSLHRNGSLPEKLQGHDYGEMHSIYCLFTGRKIKIFSSMHLEDPFSPVLAVTDTDARGGRLTVSGPSVPYGT